MKRVSTHEAKTHLSQLLAQVEQGDEIVLCRRNQPVARLVPFSTDPAARKRPRVGTRTSEPVRYEADAFEPLTDGELETAWGL